MLPRMSDQAPHLGYTAAESAPSAEAFNAARAFPGNPLGRTRYQRRSGSLPHLEDQPGVGLTTMDLPKPVSSYRRPLERLRDLISN
jgi:hypothetical protein